MGYGRYQIVRVLGEGSMGVVYLALDPKISRSVALKVLRQDRLCNEAFVKRFLREAKAIGRLSHPGIVTIYDIGEDAQTVYISMELLEGKPLNEIARTRRFSAEEIIDLGIQIGDALNYAHQKGIVHRDIKPSNIVFSSSGRIKITDFGIAHIDDPEATQHTQLGEILGTPAYMSPEQVAGQPADGRSDLFSLGVILYELAAGSRPFKGENIAMIFRSITDDNPREPSSVCPGVPGELSKVIMKCLQKEAGARYSTGSELCEALRRCRDNMAKAAMIPAPRPKPAGYVKAGSIAAGVTIIAAGVWGAGVVLKARSRSLTDTAPVSSPVPSADHVAGEQTAAPDAPGEGPNSALARVPPPVPYAAGIKAFYLDSARRAVELKDTDILTAGDYYYLTFTPKHALFLYIVQIDAAGSISWIFPNREYSSRNNPVTPEAHYRFPEKDYFGVDATAGRENILIVASISRVKELDEISGNMAQGAKTKQWTSEFNKIFSRQQPYNVRKISFMHK